MDEALNQNDSTHTDVTYVRLDEEQGAPEGQTQAYIRYFEDGPQGSNAAIRQKNHQAASSAGRQGDSAHNVTEHTGFPNPATDNTLTSLNINELLIKHPASTFFMQIEGHQWQRYGIFNGDIAIIDRSLSVLRKDVVVYWAGGDFGIKRRNSLPVDTTVWGVVTAIVHRYRP